MMKKQLLILLMIFSIGLSSEEFIENGIGSKGPSLGLAYYLGDDVESAFYNPAFLPSHTQQVKFVVNEKWGHFSEQYLAYSTQLYSFNVAVTYFHSQINEGIVGTTYDSTLGNGFLTGVNHSYYNSLMMLSLSRQVLPETSFGVSLKRTFKFLSVTEATAYGIDVGVKHELNPNFITSLKLTNIYSTGYTWSTETEQPKSTIESGVGLRLDKNTVVHIGQTITGYDWELKLGAETKVGPLTLMGGKNDRFFALGMEYEISDWMLDYSYINYLGDENLSAVHKFGISFIMPGEEVFEAPKKVTAKKILNGKHIQEIISKTKSVELSNKKILQQDIIKKRNQMEKAFFPSLP